MFGYVKTDLPNMYVKDTVLYRAMYCSLCKGIGRTCGQTGRLALNYDMTFLSVFVHNLAGTDVKITKQRCAVHWFVGKPIAEPDDITDKIAALNIILAYYKLSDDVIDGGKGRLKRSFFKKAYKRAKKAQPELENIVKGRYNELLAYEKIAGDSIDMAADPFGNMIRDVVAELLKEKADQSVLSIAYNLGKWIYLIDALDDFDKDLKKKNYNVLVNAYPGFSCRDELMNKKRQDIEFVFTTLLAEISREATRLKYNFNHDLTDNILLFGLKQQTLSIMENKKCKSTTKF